MGKSCYTVGMSIPIHKSHNVSQLLYHLVCPVKYRRLVFKDIAGIDSELKQICLEIELRYDILFKEIGVDEDHAHFLIQSVPMISPKQIAQIVKSITAREIFRRQPEVKHLLWGGEFWTKGYYISSVGHAVNEHVIQQYVKNQGKVYQQLHTNQRSLFDTH